MISHISSHRDESMDDSPIRYEDAGSNHAASFQWQNISIFSMAKLPLRVGKQNPWRSRVQILHGATILPNLENLPARATLQVIFQKYCESCKTIALQKLSNISMTAGIWVSWSGRWLNMVRKMLQNCAMAQLCFVLFFCTLILWWKSESNKKIDYTRKIKKIILKYLNIFWSGYLCMDLKKLHKVRKKHKYLHFPLRIFA